MGTTYTQHPAGYPQYEYSVTRAGNQWAVTLDVWDTATSHDGARRLEGRYRTKGAAESAAEEMRAQRGNA